MLPVEKIKAIQRILEVTADGDFGPKSRAALEALISEVSSKGVVKGLASSFADPADVASFRKCKTTGKSDLECFKVGDNGVGKWGKDTTGSTPMCALPPEDWQHLIKPQGTKVKVTVGPLSVICELQDTMPKKANIKNGAVIDLNPAAAKALGLKPPFMVPCTWQWA